MIFVLRGLIIPQAQGLASWQKVGFDLQCQVLVVLR
jgi:hypothetical protein